MEYEIVKILNNNAILMKHKNDMYIGLGAGIGFNVVKGNIVHCSKIEKIFTQSSSLFLNKLSSSIRNLDENLYPLVSRIIDYIEEQMDIMSTDQLYLSLAEHIGFVKTRVEKSYTIPCPIEQELKLLYPKEYLVSEWIVDQIEQYFGFTCPEEEIALIALHILNTTLSKPKDDVVDQFQMVKDIVRIVENQYGDYLDKNSLEYTRLLTHLNFLSKRVFMPNNSGKLENNYHNIFFDSNCADAIECSSRIKMYIKENYKFELSKNEVDYLIIHIQNCMERD